MLTIASIELANGRLRPSSVDHPLVAAIPVTGWVRRIQLPDVIKTSLISILMGAKMQLLEVVTGHSQFLSHFSIPQAMPTQPVNSRTIDSRHAVPRQVEGRNATTPGRTGQEVSPL